MPGAPSGQFGQGAGDPSVWVPPAVSARNFNGSNTGRPMVTRHRDRAANHTTWSPARQGRLLSTLAGYHQPGTTHMSAPCRRMLVIKLEGRHGGRAVG
jgi:hypothetical protein